MILVHELHHMLFTHAVAGYKWFLVKHSKILRELLGKGVFFDEGDGESYASGDLFAADPWVRWGCRGRQPHLFNSEFLYY